MSAPRAKRQFAGAASDPAQRQITSFLSTPNTTSPSSANGNYIDSASPLQSATAQRLDGPPNLSASVQANLLSVGMRVRKSVPEGYKTGSYSAFALWDESDADPIEATMGEGQRSRANAFSSPRELLPFCGIHRVGGLATQPSDHRPTPSMPAGVSATPAYQPGLGLDGINAENDIPGLTSSQETVESNGPDTARTRKRFFAEDDEDDVAGQLNPWRYSHHHSSNNNNKNNSNTSLSPFDLAQNNGRAMAVPRKGRLRAKFSGATTAMPGAGQENLMVVDDDFEEAAFLDQGTWEVDMHDA